MQARDFYDLWYLLEEHAMDANFFIREFEVKCKKRHFFAHQNVYL